MQKIDALQDLVDSPVSRRAFAIRTMGAGLGLGGAVLTGAGQEVFAQGITDVDILNFDA